MSFARSLAILLVLGLVGLVGYQIGISQQIATAAPGVAPALAPVAYGYYPWHFGFGFFGLLFPLFFLFIFFGLIRAAFGGGRGWGGGHGTYSRWGRMEEMHEELHRAKTDKPSGASSGPSGTAT
jgi:hypothetical protein